MGVCASKMGNIKLSVIIPTGFGSDNLPCTLSSLSSNDFSHESYEVIIVTYNNTAHILEMVEKPLSQVIVCSKRGNAAARNKGAEKAKGNIVCFIEPDVVVPADWLTRIFHFFSQHPDAEGVGGPILPFDSATGIQNFAAKKWLVDSDFPKEEVSVKPWVLRGSLFAHNCAYRKKGLLSIGGFDESFISSAEDIELCWRLAAQGKLLVFDPSLIVYHIFPQTLLDLMTQYFRWGVGFPRLDKKNPSKNKFKSMAFRYYNMVKALLSIALPTEPDATDRLLNFIQLASWNLGRIAGYRICSS